TGVQTCALPIAPHHEARPTLKRETARPLSQPRPERYEPSATLRETIMPLAICTACGTQYPDSDRPPAQCVICEEERQYVPPRGQSWTTLEALQQSHSNTFRQYAPGIIGIGSSPAFAIGQRALLLRTEAGNILWDCIATLDDATVALIEGLGGIDAIAISHPHFYTTMVEWARAFTARIHLHTADRQWIQRPDPAIEQWAGGAGGKGVVCAGDILTVATDRKWLSFMRSYPNFIPLDARTVARIGKA